MNLNNLPEPLEVVTFNRGVHEYNISTKYRNILCWSVGAGAGGGGGFTRSTGDGGGGGGGRPGFFSSTFLPTFLVPKKIRITVPVGGLAGSPGNNGGGGTLSTIAGLGDGDVNTWFSTVQGAASSNAGGGGTATTGGAQGGSGGSGTSNNLFIGFSLGTQNSNSGSFTGIGTNSTSTTNFAVPSEWVGRPNEQGLGGGGIVSAVGYAGKGIDFGSTSLFFPNTTQPGGTTGATGGDGLEGLTYWGTGAYKIFPISFGGTGGGAGTTGAGGRGGKGGVGSGGGGGGSGNPGGAGGAGGDGLVILVLW